MRQNAIMPQCQLPTGDHFALASCRPLRQSVWPPSPEALEQQVLLLDSQADGACSSLSLAALLNQSAASCSAEPACRTKLGIKGR